MAYEDDLAEYLEYIQGISGSPILGQYDRVLLLKIVSMLSEPLGIGNYEDEYAAYLEYLNSKYRWSSDSERNFLLFRIINIISKAGNSQYKGTWNPNASDLPETSDLKIGDWYLVSNAGTNNLIDWELYDTAKWNGTSWDRIPYPGVSGEGAGSSLETSSYSLLTANYSIAAGNSTKFFYLDPNSSTFIVNLPSATSSSDKKYSIINKGAAGSLSIAIEGTEVGVTLTSGATVACHSDGSDWNLFLDRI